MSEPSKSRKPRKKQAVKKTYSAITKALVDKNESTSILLSIPLEVREYMLRLIMGDRLIHIKQLHKQDLAEILLLESKDPGTVPNTGGLCSAFCVAEKSEQEAYHEANFPCANFKATGNPAYIATCKERHKDCLMCGPKQKGIQETALQAKRITFNADLSVLAACRLLYEEGNNVLLQSNTFSFDDSNSLKTFIASMNPSQKHKLKKIHISINVAIDDDYLNAFTGWKTAFAPRTLAPLTNLKTLHLTFDQYCLWDYAQYSPPLSTTRSQNIVISKLDMLLGLRMLPWKDTNNVGRGKHVTVMLSDDASTHSGLNTPGWTKVQKLEVAEKLRAKLAAPESKEIHEAETIATRAAQKEKVQRFKEEHRRGRINYLPNLITDAEARVEVAKEKLRRRNADADRWKGKLDQAKDKKLSNVEQIQQDWRYRTHQVGNAQGQLEKLDERLKDLEAELADLLADPASGTATKATA